MSTSKKHAKASGETPAGPFANPGGAVERLPLLRTALEQTASGWTEALHGLTTLPCRLILQDIRTGSAEQLLPAETESTAVGVLSAWGAELLACARRDTVSSIVEMMLGGGGGHPDHPEDRQLTKIDTRVAGLLFASMAKALSDAFATIARTSVTLQSTTDRVDFDAVGKETAFVVARFKLDALGRDGEILVAVPHAVFSSMHQALSKVATKTLPRPDPHWTRQIQKELTRANVTLSAVLEERVGLLSEISSLKVGQVISLDATSQSRLAVECNGTRLMWCHLGKSNGFYTLRVESFVDREQEFMDDILAA